MEGDSAASPSGAGSSSVETSDGELGLGGIERPIWGTGRVCVRVEGRNETSITCGSEATNGFIRENASEILFESFRPTGLVGEAGELLTKVGDEGAEDIRLITLFCGKTAIPHLLTGRTGAGVRSGGVTGESGLDETAAPADF